MSAEDTHAGAAVTTAQSRRPSPTELQDRLTGTADVLGRKWYLVIIHQLAERGPLGFSALKTEVDGISSKVLSNSLDDLGEKGLIDRRIVSERPFRVEYSLTGQGRLFEPIIETIREDFDELAYLRTDD